MPESASQKFSAEIEPYLDKLFRAAHRLTGTTPDAEDLVQDTCVRAFTKARDFAASTSPLAWLMRVQYNIFIDNVRARRRATLRPLDEADPSSLTADRSTDPEVTAATEQQTTLLDRAWTKLKRHQQALLGLRAEGYSIAEIGKITGLSAKVINARVHRARRSLARLLQRESDSAVPARGKEARR